DDLGNKKARKQIEEKKSSQDTFSTWDNRRFFSIISDRDAGDSKSAGISSLKLKQPGFQDLGQEEEHSTPGFEFPQMKFHVCNFVVFHSEKCGT
ncbi:10780_t:CDS:2, partial [Funneliformis geosporum]